MNKCKKHFLLLQMHTCIKQVGLRFLYEFDRPENQATILLPLTTSNQSLRDDYP